MKVLIVCRGPIAEEALRIMATLDMPRPDIVVSRREWLDTLERQATWISDRARFAKIHLVGEYSDIDTILAIAAAHNIEAIFVGYGFLAENAEFARKCEQARLCFIGPQSDVMEMLASKHNARALCQKLDIPVAPGCDALEKVILAKKAEEANEMGEKALVHALQRLVRERGVFANPSEDDFAVALEQSMAQAQSQGIELFSEKELLDTAREQAQNLWREGDFPIRIKASAGGGGKGQRVVYREEQIEKALREVWSEIGASKVGNNKSVILEANIVQPRHMEVQILGDGKDVVHFGVRDCSLQTPFYQKLLEIAVHEQQLQEMLKNLDGEREYLREELRQEIELIQKLQQSAVKLGRHLKYRSAGTVEFLVDSERNFYFMEVNARLQVEHGVSEAVSLVRGKPVSLVAEQLRIARGEDLGYTQESITFRGYALEARISLLDSQKLQPAPGATFTHLHFPPGEGIRIEDSGISTALQQRREVVLPPVYDANFALNIYSGSSFAEVLDKACGHLRATEIDGNSLQTTTPFHLVIYEWLRRNQPIPRITTGFIEIYLCLVQQIHERLDELYQKVVKETKAAKRDPKPCLVLLREVVRRLVDTPALAVAFMLRHEDLLKSSPLHILQQLTRELKLSPWPEDEQFLHEGIHFCQTLAKLAEKAGVPAHEFFAALDSSGEPQQKLPRALELVVEIITVIEAKTSAEVLSALRQKWLKYTVSIGKLIAELISIFSSSAFWELSRRNKSCAISIPTHLQSAQKRREILEKIFSQGSDKTDDREIASPILGLFYRSPKPGDPPFVKVGAKIHAGETLFLVGAMKVYVEVTAPRSGVVREILADDETLVSPGQVVMKLE